MLLQVIHIRYLWNCARLMTCSNFTNWHVFLKCTSMLKCTRYLYMKWYVIIRFFYNINVLMGSHSVYGIYALLPLSHWVWGQLNCQTCIEGQLYMMSHISYSVILSFDLNFLIDVYIIYVHNCHLWLLGHFPMSSAYFGFLFFSKLLSIYMCMCVYVYLYVYIYVRMYVYVSGIIF